MAAYGLAVSRAQDVIALYRDSFGAGDKGEVPDKQVARRVLCDLLDWVFEFESHGCVACVNEFLAEAKDEWDNGEG